MPTRHRNLERFTDARRAEALKVARDHMARRLGLGPDRARQLDDVLRDTLDAAVGVLIRGGPPPTEIILDSPPTAENALTGDVTTRLLVFDTDEAGPGGYQSIHVILRPHHAIMWAVQMLNAADHAWEVRADSWRLGNCATCGNRRMTKDPNNPRSGDNAIHCPDCAEVAPDADAYPAARRSVFAPTPPNPDETRRVESPAQGTG